MLAFGPAAGNALRRTPQVLYQHDAQRDSDGPQLTDGQRLYALVSLDEAAQQLWVEAAVGVGDECPGDAKHARIASQRAIGELGQLAIVPRRQILMDLPDLLFNHVVVVYQP